MDIYRYEIGVIINNNRYTVACSNDLEQATIVYEQAIDKYTKNKNDHVIVFMYDYDKIENLNYYDNEID